MTTKFRWAALLALIAITVAYAYWLLTPHTRQAEPQAPDHIVHVVVVPDGSVYIDAQHYTNSVGLKAKIDAIQSVHPHTSFELLAARDLKSDALGKAALLFQQSGAYKIVFITAPAKTTKDSSKSPVAPNMPK